MPLGRRIYSSATNQPGQGNEFKTTALQAPSNPIEPDNIDQATMLTLFQAEQPQYSFSDIILNNSTYDAIQDVLVHYVNLKI